MATKKGPNQANSANYEIAGLFGLVNVSGESSFFDYDEPVVADLDQVHVAKSPHKLRDSGAGRADHLGQFFVGDPLSDYNASRIFLS